MLLLLRVLFFLKVVRVGRTMINKGGTEDGRMGRRMKRRMRKKRTEKLERGKVPDVA